MRYVNLNILALTLAICLISPELFAQAGTQGSSVRLPEQVDVRTVPIEEEGKSTPEGQAESGSKEEMVYLNVSDQDIKDVIKQISKATGKNFIIDDKVRGKVTILSERMMSKEEAYQAFLSALEVAGFTTVTGPGGMIKIVPLKLAISSPIPIYVDSTPQTDSYVTRLITMQNISALEMSSAIKDLISKNGNMFAYPATNTLVITDSGNNIDRLMKIIKELDQEGPQQVLEIIPVNYATAKDIAATVLSLFEIEQKSTSSRTTRRRTKSTSSQSEDLKDVSKIIADERTNSLIVLASKRAIPKVRAVIKKLDVPLDLTESGNIHVHYLKYANAKEMAETLSSITSGAKTAAAKGKAGGKGDASTAVASLGDGVSIGADESTNALIITAEAKDYRILVDELISKLDVPRRQVYLESIVMELEVTNQSTAGATGYGGYGGGSMIGFGGSQHSDFNPAQFFTPGGMFNTPGMLGGLLSRDTITIDIPNTSGSGTQEMTIPAFAAFLNFLSTHSQANIVSTPNILTLDNQKAMIDVSKTIYAKKVSQSGTTGFQSIEPTPLEAGLTLEITPQITEGDAVRLEIHHKLSNFTGPVSAETGAADTTKREIQTTVMAMDGQTVVLGGLMQDIDTTGKSKIPLLGDIPIIGWLFSYRTKLFNKTNLLVFITPHVIRDPTDFSEISRRKIKQRNEFLDKNYSRRRQRSIRDTIARHRADLLEYADPISAPIVTPVSAPTNVPVMTPAGQSAVRSTSSGSVAAKQPVITVAPLGTAGNAPTTAYGGSTTMQPVRPVPKQQAPIMTPGTPKIDEGHQPDLAY